MRFGVTQRYLFAKTAWKPLGMLSIRFWGTLRQSMNTIQTPGAQLRLTRSLRMTAVGLIPSRSQTKRWKRQNEGRARRARVQVRTEWVRYRLTRPSCRFCPAYFQVCALRVLVLFLCGWLRGQFCHF